MGRGRGDRTCRLTASARLAGPVPSLVRRTTLARPASGSPHKKLPDWPNWPNVARPSSATRSSAGTWLPWISKPRPRRFMSFAADPGPRRQAGERATEGVPLPAGCLLFTQGWAEHSSTAMVSSAGADRARRPHPRPGILQPGSASSRDGRQSLTVHQTRPPPPSSAGRTTAR